MVIKMFNRICVFCGSSTGFHPGYQAAAAELADYLCEAGITLVYGGGKVGLMGALAKAMLAQGGNVIGVAPDFLVEKKVVLDLIPDLRIVSSMHERKALMAELSDGFIALPGGMGTLEELIEVLTWLQLGLHNKPCGVLNVSGFFDPLFSLLEHMSTQGFIHPKHAKMLMGESSAKRLIHNMVRFAQPEVDKARWALGN